jgi:hypothetical protein
MNFRNDLHEFSEQREVRANRYLRKSVENARLFVHLDLDPVLVCIVIFADSRYLP